MHLFRPRASLFLSWEGATTPIASPYGTPLQSHAQKSCFCIYTDKLSCSNRSTGKKSPGHGPQHRIAHERLEINSTSASYDGGGHWWDKAYKWYGIFWLIRGDQIWNAMTNPKWIADAPWIGTFLFWPYINAQKFSLCPLLKIQSVPAPLTHHGKNPGDVLGRRVRSTTSETE